LSAYSTFFTQNSWYLDGVLSWGNNTYDINRRILYTLVSGAGTTTVNQTATSSSGGNTLAGALTFGRDVAKGPWSFGPYFRGTWTHTSFDAYQETLKSSLPGNGLGLDVQSRNVNSIASVLGAKVNYASSQSWGVMMPHAEVEWEHEYRNSPDSITASFLQDPTATPIQLNGDPVDTNFFRLGLGLSFVFTGGRSGFVYYEKTLGLTGITQDTIALGFRMEF
jgi:outer membrane autotransporter protein